MANAVELSVEQAWFLADLLGAGSFPWVLAITPPYAEPAARHAFDAEKRAELRRLGVLADGDSAGPGDVDPVAARCVIATCRPRRWLELRVVTGSGAMLRGQVARRDDDGVAAVVVALRSGQLVAFTELDVDHPQALVPVLTAGLPGRSPARFAEFTIQARIGAKADERLRRGDPLDAVIDFLGIPATARAVVAAAFAADRTYVEIVAGDHRDGHRVSTEVGVSVVDTAEGRILVSPARAFDGEWVSTFTPGTPLAIATAVERLTATLPDGPWFPHVHLTQEFDQRRDEQPCPKSIRQPAAR